MILSCGSWAIGGRWSNVRGASGEPLIPALEMYACVCICMRVRTCVGMPDMLRYALLCYAKICYAMLWYVRMNTRCTPCAMVLLPVGICGQMPTSFVCAIRAQSGEGRATVRGNQRGERRPLTMTMTIVIASAFDDDTDDYVE